MILPSIPDYWEADYGKEDNRHTADTDETASLPGPRGLCSSVSTAGTASKGPEAAISIGHGPGRVRQKHTGELLARDVR